MGIRENIIITAQDNTTRGFRSVQNKMTSLERLISRVHTTLLGFVGINIAQNLIRDMVGLSDTAVELNAKLALVTNGVDEQATAQKTLLSISKESGSALESNTVLYTRMARPLKALNFTMGDTLKFTKLVAQGLRISGASAQESNSTIRQLSQAMQSGVLRGEEYNALLENGGRIAIALADGLGVTLGQMRAMSKQGKLTAESVVKALNQQADAIDAENKRLPLTIGRSLENIKSEFLSYFTTVGEGNRKIANELNHFADNMQTIIPAAFKVAKVAAVVLTGYLIKYSAQRARTFAQEKLAAAEKARLDEQEILRKRAKARIDARNALANTQARLQAIRLETALMQTKEKAYFQEVRSLELQIKRSQEQIKQRVQEINALRGSKQRAIAVSELTALYAKEKVIVESLTVAKTKLAGVQTKMAASANLETTAINANSAALVNNAKAHGTFVGATGKSTGVLTNFIGVLNGTGAKVTSFLGKFGKFGAVAAGVLGKLGKAGSIVGGLFTGLLRFIPKLVSGLLGIPGLVLFALYSILEPFVDFRLLLELVIFSVKKLLLILTNPIDALFGGGDLQAKLAALDKEFSDWSDARIAETNAQKKGVEDAETAKIKALQERKREEVAIAQAIAQNEKQSLKIREDALKNLIKSYDDVQKRAEAALAGQIKTINAEVLIQKDTLRQRYTNEADYQRNVDQLEQQAIQDRLDATLAHTADLLDTWDSFYEDQLGLVDSNSREYDDLRQKQLDKELELQSQSVEAFRAATSKMIQSRATLLQKIANDEQAANNILKHGAEFLATVFEDQTTAKAKAAAAQRKIDEARADLQRANTLDTVKDAEEIKRIRVDALKTLESVAKSEVARFKAAKAGSTEATDAEKRAHDAVNLYKGALSATNDAIKQVKKNDESRAASMEKSITRNITTVNGLVDSINKINTELSTLGKKSINVDTTQAIASVEALQSQLAKLKDKEITIRVNRVNTGGDVETHAVGGVAGSQFKRRQNTVPGYGAGDHIPALLEPGEFIVRKSAVRSLGSAILHNYINRGELPPIAQHASGGLAGSTADARKELNKIADRINRKASTGNKLSDKVASYKTKLSGYRSDERSLQTEIVTLTGESSLAQQALSLASRKLALLPSDASESDKKAAQKAVDARERDADKAAKAIERATSRLDAVSKRITDTEGKIEDANAAIADVQTEIKSLRSEFAAIRQLVKERLALQQFMESYAFNEPAYRNAKGAYGQPAYPMADFVLKEYSRAAEAVAKSDDPKFIQNARSQLMQMASIYQGQPVSIDTWNYIVRMRRAFADLTGISILPTASNAGTSSRESTKVKREYTRRGDEFALADERRKKRRFAHGGSVPGVGDSDTVDAKLTPGEFVLRKAAVAKYGRGLLHAMNSMRVPPAILAALGSAASPSPVNGVQHFNTGGEVAPGTTNGAIEVTLNVAGTKAKGLFADDSETARMIDTLRDHGVVTG